MQIHMDHDFQLKAYVNHLHLLTLRLRMLLLCIVTFFLAFLNSSLKLLFLNLLHLLLSKGMIRHKQASEILHFLLSQKDKNMLLFDGLSQVNKVQ